MNGKTFESRVLGPGYGIIVVGGILENVVLQTNVFLLGMVLGALWLAIGLAMLGYAKWELGKGEGFMLVQSGPFAWSRNPAMLAHLLGIMPGLSLLCNANVGIVGILVSTVLFLQHIQNEELDLEDRFGEVYLAYKERVARLLPCQFLGLG